MDSQREQEYVTWIAELFPPQGKWRERDYFALPESNRIIELSDGELIMTPPPTPKHQRILWRFAKRLDDFVREQGIGEIFISPIGLRLCKGKIRQPDVLFLRKESLGRVKERYIDGPADWIAEVISPRSRKTDEVAKISDYAQAGIPEYWLIDPKNSTIRVHILHEGAYVLVATYTTGQVARSETITGFEIPINQVFGE